MLRTSLAIAGSLLLLLTLTGVNGNSIKKPKHGENQPEAALLENSQSRHSDANMDIAGNEDRQSDLGEPGDSQLSSIPFYVYNAQHERHLQTAEDTPPWDEVQRLRQALKNAGLISPHVIGGEPAGAGTWPWATALFDHNDYFACGATLIKRKWVLTAAHCLSFVAGGGYVAVGAYNISSSARDALHYTPIISAHIYDDRMTSMRRPLGGSEPRSSANDIALLELMDPVNPEVPSIALPLETGLFALNPQCYFTGWGVIDPNDRVLSATLQQLNINVITNNKCQAQWDESFLHPIVYETNICTGPGTSGLVSTCSGDSGSALQCYSNSLGEYVLVGISSWSSSACAVYPSVYARVSEYTTWIDQVTGSTDITAHH